MPEHIFHFPTCGISTERQALMLAIDDALLPVKKNLCYYLSKPEVRAAPVLTPSTDDPQAPDNLAAHFYGTVLYDEGKFRMWYYACHLGRNPDWPPAFERQLARQTDELYPGPLCYAESDDGLSWRKPSLGQVCFKGSRENNALALPYALVPGCAAVVRDDSDPNPRRRYKMIYNLDPSKSDPPLEGITSWITVAAAVSPDGLVWEDAGVPYPQDFIEHASFYQHNGLYIINSHTVEMNIPGEGGTPRGRQAMARCSPDFSTWVDGNVESFTLPEPRDPAERGASGLYDQVHIGVGAASFGASCVGLYGIWHNAHFTESFDKITCDLGLLISNDGLHFREPVKGHVFLDRHDSPVTPYPGKDYHTILCQANGILNVGDETRIYHGRWRNSGYDEQGYGAEVALATLPRDRWGALGLAPDAETGAVWSAPITLPAGGCTLTLNADAADGMTVELADEHFRLDPAFTGHGHDSGLDCPVTWGNNATLPGGRTVRLKITLSRSRGAEPRLYAVNLSALE